MDNAGNGKHTFVICAYKETAFLKDCIESIRNQSVQSPIICATSTPNELVSSICAQYGIPLRVNPVQAGTASDWNFAYEQADTPLVTLAHQDDIYEPDFLKLTLEYLSRAKKPLIAFTKYYEIRDGVQTLSNRLLRIKRIMCLPWRVRAFWASRFIGRRIFMFGNPIMCPTVTIVKENLEGITVFRKGYKGTTDYLAWVEVRDLPGEFVYCPTLLLGHRIHIESETSNSIADNTRSKEDLEILSMLSPKPIAKLIHSFYVKSQSSNVVRGKPDA